MTPAVRLSIFLVLLSAIIVTGYHNSVKWRRDGVLNLYPFPRVGRASQRTWQVPLKDILYEYEPQEVKRQLYAFPRVGRDAPSHGSPQGEGAHDLQIQLHRSDSPGMWFGPRLGRGLRSEEDEISVPNYNNERSEPELMESDNNEARVRRSADQQ